MQACEMGLCLGSSRGEIMLERSQQLPQKQSCDLTGSGLTGLEVVLQSGIHKQHSTCSVPEMPPVIYATLGGVLDMFFLSCEYDSKSYYKSFPQVMNLIVLYSEQALSTITKQVGFMYCSLLPFDSFNHHCLCFFCCILNILKLHSAAVKGPHRSLTFLKA